MRFFIAFAILFSLSIRGEAKTYTASDKENKVTWIAVGFPGFLKINGEGGKITGSLAEDAGKVSGVLKVDVSKFKTGLDLRDEHMHKKYLGSDKIPEAVLTLDPVEVKAGKIPFTGKLKIKEDTKPISGEVTVSAAPGGYSVKGSFAVKITDYPSIGVPSHLGVTVAEKVDVEIDFKLEEK